VGLPLNGTDGGGIQTVDPRRRTPIFPPPNLGRVPNASSRQRPNGHAASRRLLISRRERDSIMPSCRRIDGWAKRDGCHLREQDNVCSVGRFPRVGMTRDWTLLKELSARAR
jgi:hypothetical protein